MNYKKVAGDIGNDGLKMYLGNQKNRLYIPNVIAAVEKRDIIDMEQDILSGLHVQVVSGALKKGKGSFAVGKLASGYKSNDELTPDSEKSESDQPIIVLLTGLAYDAATSFEPVNGTIEVTYDLSTGLPLNEVKRGKRKSFKEKLLNNYHEVTFLQTPELEGMKVRIRFEHVLVNTEGVAALVDLTTNDDGSLRNEELTKMDVLIQDIGGLSTDAAIIMKDGSVDNLHSEGIREGVSPYLDEINEAVEQEYKMTYFKSRKEIVDCLTHPDSEERGHIWIKGKRTSIQHIYKPILTRLAKEEYKLVNKLWGRVRSIRRAYLIGGGALILRPYIEKINQEQDELPLYFIDSDDSIWMIARAYFKLLEMYLEQKELTETK
ncbi:ParM/StbA family protein [Neobacillus sp. YIM B02564]|uniref:ParM/StbA family protein n=1 Tax=Neobacillus paridis TaxID=2803862 RepID=A0ABS1TNM1_9BACI|nr:ParM/StbA family protein [Neobacillus paridis]